MSEPGPAPSEPQARAALGADFIIPLLACGLAGYFFVSTADLVWEARATGTVIGLVLVAMCIALFARLGVRIAAGQADLSFGDLVRDDEFNRQRLALIVMVALYVATITWVGATVGLFFLLVGCMWLLGVRSLKPLVGVALTSAVLVHLALVVLLDSRLPRGVLFGQTGPAPSEEPAKPAKKR